MKTLLSFLFLFTTFTVTAQDSEVYHVIQDYLSARKQIYLQAYAWVLSNKVQWVIESLKVKAETTDLVFLDFETNGDIENVSKPLSHAAMVKRYLEKKYPGLGDKRFNLAPEKKARKKSETSKKGRKKKGGDQTELL